MKKVYNTFCVTKLINGVQIKHMKIMIIGYASTGKAKLASLFSEKYQLTQLNMEDIIYDENRVKQPKKLSSQQLNRFLRKNENWVINGNYSSCQFLERAEQASLIIVLKFNRFTCLKNAYQERKTKNQGWMKWLLYSGRNKYRQQKFNHLIKRHPDKVCVIKNQKQLDDYLLKLGISPQNNK